MLTVMADATAKKLMQLLQVDSPVELRCAAVAVLGEVGTADASLVQALCNSLDDPEAVVRTKAMEAVGKLRIDPALPKLLQRVREGGAEAENAALAAARAR